MDAATFPRIKVLFNGYSVEDADNLEITRANCTCTLIKGPPNVIVDTMTSWDGDKLLEALNQEGLSPDDIDFVICTHGHSDHIGCNYLFKKSKLIVGYCISHRDNYFDHDFQSGFEYHIGDKIRVIPTPGHTLQDVSVLVDTGTNHYGLVAITGDLFENEHDLSDDSIWKSAGSDSELLQEINRKKILNLADYIVPGHGEMFKTPE